MNPLEKQLLFVVSRIHLPLVVAPLFSTLKRSPESGETQGTLSVGAAERTGATPRES